MEGGGRGGEREKKESELFLVVVVVVHPRRPFSSRFSLFSLFSLSLSRPPTLFSSLFSPEQLFMIECHSALYVQQHSNIATMVVTLTNLT